MLCRANLLTSSDNEEKSKYVLESWVVANADGNYKSQFQLAQLFDSINQSKSSSSQKN
jgi:heat shock protein HspQ